MISVDVKDVLNLMWGVFLYASKKYELGGENLGRTGIFDKKKNLVETNMFST